MAALALALVALVVFFERSSSLVIRSTEYVRPAPSKDLELSHTLLRKRSKDPHDPEQIHLALAGPGRLAISWVTRPQSRKPDAQTVSIYPLNALQDDAELTARLERVHFPVSKHGSGACEHLKHHPLRPTAQVGSESGRYIIEVVGNFTCYGDSAYESGALHTVVLGDASPLNSSSRYYYRVGDPQYGWSDEKSFVTTPPVAALSVPYKLGLIGDLGQTSDSAATLKHLNKLDVTSVLDVGDLSYADSYQPRWDTYGRLLEAHTSKTAWMHIEGNHEEETLGGETGFVAYEKRFWFPAAESGSHSNFYYSYETGPLHIVMLGCYVDYTADSAQAAWLRRDLAAVDRARTPWLVVGMHAPWYNSNTAHQGEVDDMREDLEPLLYQHGVDAVFAGHVHAYERSAGGVVAGKRTKCAPTYIVIGDGGNREGLATEYLKKPDWSAVREASFGMGVFTVQNGSHAVWHWHRNKDSHSEVADEFWFERMAECQDAVRARIEVASSDAPRQ